MIAPIIGSVIALIIFLWKTKVGPTYFEQDKSGVYRIVRFTVLGRVYLYWSCGDKNFKWYHYKYQGDYSRDCNHLFNIYERYKIRHELYRNEKYPKYSKIKRHESSKELSKKEKR